MRHVRIGLAMRLCLVGLLFLLGCRPGTSVVVRIDSRDLAIPGQLSTVHVRVSNPELGGNEPVYDSQIVRLCAVGESSACETLPLSVVLRPGPDDPDTRVRVEVIANDGGGNEIIHDAALFRFSDGVQQEIDFHLSPACLRTYCAAQNRVCGVNGGCIDASPGNTPMASTDAGAPRGIIQRWSENAMPATESTYLLTKPPNAQPGDLLIALVASGTSPVGWTELFNGANRGRLVSHRIAETDDASTYAFTVGANTLAVGWIAASYRGVTSVEVGSVFAMPTGDTFQMESMDVTRAGSWLTTWVGKLSVLGCTRDGKPLTFNETNASLDEAPDLEPGPTGVRVYSCPQMLVAPTIGVELLLVP